MQYSISLKILLLCLSNKIHVIRIHVSRSHPGGEEKFTKVTKVLAFCPVLAHEWGEKYLEKRLRPLLQLILHSE